MIVFVRCRTLVGRIVAGGVFVSVAGFGSPVHGQTNPGWKVPIEFLQGFNSSQDEAVRPYLASIAAVPGYAFPSVRLGLRISADYENPGWTARFGPRVERQVGPSKLGIGFVLGAEATMNTDGEARVGGGLTFDVDGLLRAGLWGGWDERRDGGWFGITLGGDPTSWFGCVESTVNPGNCKGE